MALYGDGVNVTKTTSATSATYGSASSVPQITVDANQRISSISNVSITLNASINANAAAGDVGTYAALRLASGNTAYGAGSNVAGSSLNYCDCGTGNQSGTPGGTWKCMGYYNGGERNQGITDNFGGKFFEASNGQTSSTHYAATVWLRVS
jgi:hypothetical protein